MTQHNSTPLTHITVRTIETSSGTWLIPIPETCSRHIGTRKEQPAPTLTCDDATGCHPTDTPLTAGLSGCEFRCQAFDFQFPKHQLDERNQ